MNIAKIQTTYITLGQFLKFVGIASGGGDVKALLANEIINVNGELETRRGRKLYPDDVVIIEDIGSYKIAQTDD